MQAARIHGRGDIRIDEIAEPAVRAGTVMVEVEWCGICGSDLNEYVAGPIYVPPAGSPHPLTGETVPLTLGHEFAGVVVELGQGVTDLRIGDRVAVEPYIVCGRCDACQQGRYNVCASQGFVGLSGMGGGFSRYVVAERRWIHPLGGISTDVGALVEPLAVGYHAVRLSGARQGQTALVFGAGPIGLMTIAALRAVGVEKVLVVARPGLRKDMAPLAGATHIIDPTRESVIEATLEITRGRGADVTFECAGTDATLASAVKATRVGGTCVNVAIWANDARFAMNDLVLREVSLVGSLAYADDYPAVIQMITDGTIDPYPFITRRIPLQNIVSDGFDELVNHRRDHVKILVRP